MIYESRREPLLPLAAFLRRLVRHAGIAVAIVVVSLAVGMLGYRYLEGLAWIDAFLNAAMILGGMGPTNELHNTAAKTFAGFYALYSGLIVLVIAGVLFAPLFHRFLHHFHLEIEDTAAADSD